MDYFMRLNIGNKLLRTSVKYIGIDMLNNTIPLEDQWLKINFEKHAEFWDKILKLKEHETIEVPTGISGNSVQDIKILESDKGPTIQYHQTKRDQCLIFSLASETKIRVQVRKVKVHKLVEVLNDRYNDKIYHCILENHHAVMFYKQFIFDPIFENALPRSIKYLKLCAEMGHDESVEKAIFKAICYENITTKK